MPAQAENNTSPGWKTLLEYGAATDAKTLNDWKDELGNLLTFTGLFSAVVTGFIVLAIPLLQEDSGDKSAKLLAQISLQLSSFRDGAPTAAIDPSLAEPFKPDKQAVQINILWVASLTFTLMASFFTIAAQQWLRCIPLPPHLTIREAVRLRQFRQDGLIRWKIPTMISLLPVVVQISVVLFLAGLLLLLETVNSSVAIVFASIAGSTLGAFVIMVCIPVIVANCPFKTPIVPSFVAIAQFSIIPPVVVVVLVGWIACGSLVAIAVSIWNIKWTLVGLINRASSRSAREKPPARVKRPVLAPLYNTLVDIFLLQCVQAASAILNRWFWTSSDFWLSRELGSMNDVALDRQALSDAPVVVPKGRLMAVRPCLDEITKDDKLHVATGWTRHLLGLSSKTALLLNSSLHAMSFNGPLRHTSPAMFLDLREMLWSVLPTEWDGTWQDDYNRMLSMMLCLLFRSLPNDPHEDPEFLAALGQRVLDIRNSQDVQGIMPANSTSNSASVVPTSLLFHCCERGLDLTTEQISGTLEWTVSLHEHIQSQILDKDHAIPTSFRPNLMRINELSVTSAAIVFKAVACNPSLLNDTAFRRRWERLLETSARIIFKLYRPLVTYTLHIGVMTPGTHILACNASIKCIARSIASLTRDRYIERTSQTAWEIMWYLRKVCDANWERTFEDTRVYFDQYDVLCAGVSRICSVPQVV